jgi:hypothetical protein
MVSACTGVCAITKTNAMAAMVKEWSRHEFGINLTISSSVYK